MKIIARLLALCVISTHAQQCSVNDAVKDLYYDQLYAGTTSEFLIPCGDRNGHVGIDCLQSLKHFFINVSYHILVASLTLMALF